MILNDADVEIINKNTDKFLNRQHQKRFNKNRNISTCVKSSPKKYRISINHT